MDERDLQEIKQRFGIIGNSSLLNNAIRVAAQVAPTDMTVLITGESGVGKESFSKIIHSLSHRKHGQFIAINCGAIPEGTIDSELFGHEKGSFTGATEARKGYFEVTDGGTIFLDEIGEMPLGTQARLLRVLENGEFIRVGSSKVQKTDVRVVAATNVNLLQAVDKGKFREDLYYRLNTVPIFVPPLRERGSDIELLFRKFATDFADRYKVKPVKLQEEAISLLLSYRFPGNIRQLKNLAEQISVLEMDRDISAEKLANYLPREGNLTPALYRPADSEQQKEQFSEREIFYKVLVEMRRDLSEMKKLVYDLLKNEHYGNELIQDHPNLFDSMEEDVQPYEERSLPSYRLEQAEPRKNPGRSDIYDLARVEDVVHEEDKNESLSLEKNERELIVKALQRNNNKRKHAARDLGISERTLYRKIKQYEIEE